MGRLIDADAFKRQVAGMAISNNYPANKANAWCELIDEQPTAYDMDKVVEQLENYCFEKYCAEGDSEIGRIVKGGGVDGN